jgi:hypothetical protein
MQTSVNLRLTAPRGFEFMSPVVTLILGVPIIGVEATRWEFPGSIPGMILGNFQVMYSFYSHSLVLRSTQPLTEISTKEFFWGKVRPSREADNSAILAVQNEEWQPN